MTVRPVHTAALNLRARGAPGTCTTDVNVTVVTADELTRLFASAALVAVTVQVPGPVELSTPPMIEQPALPALATTKVTAPEPEPPAEVSVNGIPPKPFVLVTLRVPWTAGEMVTVVGTELAAAKLVSAAFVTVTAQVPVLEAVSAAPVIEQPALPAPVTAYETAPVPEPPVEVRASALPYVPLVLVSVSGACVAGPPPPPLITGTNVTIVADDVATKKFASAAFVTVTEQLPALVALSVVPLSEQPALPAPVTAYETAPVPEPPVEVRASALPYVPLVLVSVSAACAAWLMVRFAVALTLNV